MFKKLIVHFKGKPGISTEAADLISCWYSQLLIYWMIQLLA